MRRLLIIASLSLGPLAAAQVATTIDPNMTRVRKVKYSTNPDGGSAPCLEVAGTLVTARGDEIQRTERACPRTGAEATRATAHQNTAEAILNRAAGRDGGI